MELIDKAAVVAEIEKIYAEEKAIFDEQCRGGYEPSPSPAVVCMKMEHLLSFINTLQAKEIDLENYISNKLLELGADLINHKPYSFNRGLNVGKTNAYNDILDKLNARKEN